MKRRLTFEGEAFENFVDWAKSNKKLHEKIVTLIQDNELPKPQNWEASGPLHPDLLFLRRRPTRRFHVIIDSKNCNNR